MTNNMKENDNVVTIFSIIVVVMVAFFVILFTEGLNT